MATSTTTVDASGTFTVPVGVTLLAMVEAVGMGGAGSAGTIGGGGGGGGGAWANLVDVAVTPGDIWTVTIDATSSRAKAPGSVMDDIVAQAGSGTIPGAAASSTGDNKKSGGAGGAGGATVGGGGGSAPSNLASANAGVDGDSGGAGGAATIGTYINGGAGGDAPSNNGELPGGGGAGGNSSGSTSGGTGGGGRLAFTWITADGPPQESRGYVRPIPGTDFAPAFPGAVLFSRGLAAATSPPAAVTGMPSVYHVETPIPPPFPGEVKFWANPYGDPPPATASGQLSQFKIETENPPPFPGMATVIRPPLGETPTPPSVSTAVHSMAEVAAPEPGRVLHALTTPFGISAIPARPMRAETEQPIPFAGAVIAARGLAEYVRDPLPLPPPVIRESESIPPLSQPRSWSGVPQRDATFQQTTVREMDPPQYMGGVSVGRSAFGLESLPLNRPLVVSSPSMLEPGGVTFTANRNFIPDPSPPIHGTIAAPLPPPGFPGRVTILRSDFGTERNENPRPSLVQAINETPAESGRIVSFRGQAQSLQVPLRPSVATITPSADALVQPRAWGGVPQRDAPHNTARVVVQAPSLVEPGGAFVGRPTFGISPTPARPVVVREASGTSWASPGEVRYSRPVEPAPVMPSRSIVVSSVSVQEPGRVLFSRAESPPSVRPMTYLIAGNTDYLPPSQPFFGWGWRTGTGAPPDPGAGYPVTLYGYDRSVITLTSIPDCEC